MVDFKSFDQEKLSKKQVLTRLLTCAVGLNVSFLITGIAQERIITQPYSGGEYFTSSYGLVFLNRLGGFIISALLFYITKPAPTTAIVYEFSFPSVTNMLSSWCQYEALKYVSFPTQSLFKCFKLAPIMLMGKALG
jgi:adenosine 3'-phospho 5'-phosphosulfate transporter B2